ncbi:histidine kinase [Nonomuraea sp. NN258]|uniref:histidine kinase dimerization/phosphoacceptor domain-containing protein n=1 Tax=Nonomuraea antri TaxID=2730852 RepID=UPI0015687909|nr:histidine kinase dimerization/phosphoacceptor domain-containing protein [Nonomuraea antri]NRQ38346.1 histidine kinase [Nonomuraea antri]
MRWNRSLPRRWACLILGGALLMPYMMAGVLTLGLAREQATTDLFLPAQAGVFAAVLPVVALTGLFLPVRGLEVNAAQGLLGVNVDTPPRHARRSWQERRRTSAWFTLHLGIGGLTSGFTLAVVPYSVFTLVLPFGSAPRQVFRYEVSPGWEGLAWAASGVAVLGLLIASVAGAGALLARLAPALLGPTPAERLAAAEEHARTLAERNRLARELHDSVGHALSVVTLQAAAPDGCSTATPSRPGRRWPRSSSPPGPRWRTSTTSSGSCAKATPSATVNATPSATPDATPKTPLNATPNATPGATTGPGMTPGGPRAPGGPAVPATGRVGNGRRRRRWPISTPWWPPRAPGYSRR